MSAASRTSESAAGDVARDATPPAQNLRTPARALREFHLFHPWVEFAAPALPALVALVTLVSPLVPATDIMFFSGLASATAASALVVMLRPVARRALETVWTAKVLVAPAGPSESAFVGFIDRFSAALNSVTGSIFLGVAFAIFATPQFFLALPDAERSDLGGLLDPARVSLVLSTWPLLRTVAIAFTALLGLALGLFAWRMLMIGVYMFRLGREFDTNLQSNHPDGAGGMAPIGTLCLLNALILTVPSIFLGVWRTLIATIPAFGERYGYLANWFSVLLVVTVVLALVGFILPLYSIHRAMARDREGRSGAVERMSSELADLAAKTRSAAEQGKTDDLAKLKEQHELLAQIYVRERDLPTWPLDSTVVRGYVISQIVPLLSLSKLVEEVQGRVFRTP